MSLITRIRNLETKLGSNSAAEEAVLHSVTAGCVSASKALVVDGNKTLDVLQINGLKTRFGNVAAGGTAIGNATVLSAGVNRVTGADNTAAVKLPALGSGSVKVINTVGNKTLPVFATDGNTTINEGAGGGNISVAAGVPVTFEQSSATGWTSFPKVPS